jgi:hypothetical protein
VGRRQAHHAVLGHPEQAGLPGARLCTHHRLVLMKKIFVKKKIICDGKN